MLRGWLKMLIVTAGCRAWIGEETAYRLIQFFGLRHV